MSKRRSAVPVVIRHLTKLELRADDLPKGVCGVIQGIALTYNQPDSYGTLFRPGCLDRTKNEKVRARKVQLFCDHEYGVRTHVGVVVAMDTAGDAEIMTAHLFDTEDGRRTKEYVAAVLEAHALTGLSIGFYEREGAWSDTDKAFAFEEVELEETSITPRPAVPGANMTGVRSDPASDDGYITLLRGVYATLGPEQFRAVVRAVDPDGAPASNATATPDSNASTEDSDASTRTDSGDSTTATMEERLLAYRLSLV